MLLNEGSQVFPYNKADYEEVPCNLCQGRDVVRLGNRDRNGMRVRTVICKRCGFIFISPRMTPEWYARYYESEYRHQMARYHGKPMLFRPDVMYQYQLRHGRWIARYLRQQNIEKLGSILELGRVLVDCSEPLATSFRPRLPGSSHHRRKGILPAEWECVL